MSYVAMSTIVWVVMNCLGEMTTYLPVRGVSVPYFIHRFTEPSLGFAAGRSHRFVLLGYDAERVLTAPGYNYWYSFSMLLASEVTACSMIIQYWTTSINVAVWITIVLVGMRCYTSTRC